VLVDWECAGEHAADWDLALVFTQLAPEARVAIDEVVAGGPRARAFAALVTFALVRERAFLDAFRTPPDAPARLGIEVELAAALERLRALA
jgi:hypothetical protein